MRELACQIIQKKQEDKQIKEEQAANARYWKIPTSCDDDDDYNSAITLVLSTEEPVDSLSIGDEHLDTISATKLDKVIKSTKDHFDIVIKSKDDISSSDDDSLYNENIEYDEATPHDSEVVSLEVAEIVISEDKEIKDDNLRKKLLNVHEVIKSSVEDLVPIPSEFEGILDTTCDVHLDNNHAPLEAKDHFEIVINSNDDISSSDDDSLHEENIEYVEASPHDFELVSLEAAEIVIPKVKEIEDDNLREKLLNVHLLIANIEALKDNPTPSSELLTKSSSTSLNSFLEETNIFHNSLPEFENFYFDLGGISSGSTTTHSDISLSEYDSFIFDFANEEFVDELANIISPPEYDCFYFWNLLDSGELMSVLNFGIRENLSTTLVNLPIEDDHSPLLAYVV
nr:hypothetical protein [Tanacetum cinerariifolium]